MEAVIFDFREALLLSSIAVVGFFAVIQSYIRPFRNKFANLLDLTFMGVFLLLSAVTLYLNPSTNGFTDVNIAVSVLGYFGFALFLLVILYHIFQISKQTPICESIIKQCQNWQKMIRNVLSSSLPSSSNAIHLNHQYHMDHGYHCAGNSPALPEEQYQESLFEHLQ